MDFLYNVTRVDYIIIALSFVSAGIFAALGNDKLFKFYFGAIIGFLLFLVFNSEIAVISLLKDGMPLDSWQNFLSKNQTFVLNFFACMIPVFGLFFTLNNTIHFSLGKAILQSIIFGTFLVPFLLGIYVYIDVNSFITLQFFKDLLGILEPSAIKGIFQKAPHLVFIFLLFVLFYKMIWGFFMLIISSIFGALASVAKKSQEHQEKHHEHHEEEHSDEDSHDDHHSHH